MNRISKIAGIGGMVVAFSVAGANANALSLTIQEIGSAAIIVDDNGAGDNNAAAGVIEFSGNTQDFNVVVGIGQGSPATTNANGNQIGTNLTFVASSAADGGQLSLKLEDQNVSLANLIDTVSLFTSFALDGGGKVTASTSVSVNGGTPTILGDLIAEDGAESAEFTSFLAGLTSTDLFSFTTDVLIEGDKFDISSGDIKIEAAVPVPAALPLFATALFGLGLLGRRRARG